MIGLIKSVVAICMIAGLLSIGAGCWIPVKGAIAQQLLHRAWEQYVETETKEDNHYFKPWPWADTWPIGRLSSPHLGVDLIVLEGDSGESLAFGPGHLIGSAPPGASGHCVLAGHRDTSFKFLQKLQRGDELILEGKAGIKNYRVYNIGIVKAEELYLDGSKDGVLTLITCFPFDGLSPNTSLRYLVTAHIVLH